VRVVHTVPPGQATTVEEEWENATTGRALD
jgi:hypothetical protein